MGSLRVCGLRAAALLVLPCLALQVGSTSAGASDDVGEEAPLTAALTATGTVARSYAWSVENVADATVRSTGVDGTATFRSTVTARAGAMTESDRTLGGQVTVTNPDASPGGAVTADVDVATTLGGGSCTVPGGNDAVIPASDEGEGQLTLSYTCSFTSTPASSGTVSATVTWDPAGAETNATVGASAPVSFDVTTEVDKIVSVVADQTVAGQRVVLDPALAWSAGLVKTYAYDLSHVGGAPGVCSFFTDTATIDEPTGTDPSASATVRACVPEVLPAQAFGRATGSVSASCRGTVRTRLSNRSDSTASYRLTVGGKTRRISVRSLGHKKIVTQGQALAVVTLKVGSTRLDRVRIPQRCAAPGTSRTPT